MRKIQFLILAVLVALPLQAGDDRHQTYISYDDGGTMVRQAEDNREIEARVNLPIFAGDEITTNRRGRTEVRLADGNVIAIDRATAVNFRSMLANYEDEDASETVVDLRYGQVMIYRTDRSDNYVRLDTKSASYFASSEAIFSVESDGSRGKDRVTIFEGAIEVRTPVRRTRMRAGEEAHVDDSGLYGLVSDSRGGASDFERWFLRRAERYGRNDSRYLDRRLSYYDNDLAGHGSWVTVAGLGYGWRPYVSVGWRPYYHGYWARGRRGSLIWVSYEPWGWAPYHYGRWAHDPGYGWVWLPGTGYAPAWVYWMYGNGYVGWAPTGWWDCSRPYHTWAYQPYVGTRAHFGFGFYGRVRVDELDLRPWTFVGADGVFSNRIDRAALTTDAIRARLGREGGRFATVSSAPARFTREQYKDPAAAINGFSRRAFGSGTGTEGPGSSVDMTPFFRRDPELSTSIRDRIVRSRSTEGIRAAGPRTATGGGTGSVAPIGGGSVAPIGGGNVAPIGREAVAPVGRGGLAPSTSEDAPARDGWRRDSSPAGRINRGSRDTDTSSADRSTTRSTIGGRAADEKEVSEPAAERVERPRRSSSGSGADWRSTSGTRGGSVERDVKESTEPRSRSTVSPRDSGSRRDEGSTRSRSSSSEGGSDVPRRVIDRIGGARVSRSDDAPARSSAPPPRSSGRESSPPARTSSPEPRSSGSSSRSSGSEGSSSSSGKSEGGGRIKRD